MRKRSLASSVLFLLDTAWYAIALLVAITVCLVLVGANIGLHIDVDGPSVEAGPNVAMSIPVSLIADARTYSVGAPSLGIDQARLSGLRGALRFPVRKGLLFWTTLVIVIGSMALLLWVLGQLRGLFRTLRDGHPFVAANATRVRRIAWGAIIGELARSTVVFFENYYAATHFSAAGLTFDARPHVNAFAIVNGLIILAIAEVFREGTRLEEDRSLTI